MKTTKVPEQPKDDRRPGLRKAAFVCPHCTSFAQQDWSELMVWEESSDPSPDEYVNVREPMDFYSVGNWMHARCVACKHSSIWLNNTMVYPPVNTLPAARAEMPERAKALYQESREVAQVSKRAGAAMARATLEVLLRILLPDAPKNSNLDELTVLAEPQVSVRLATRLHVLRESGNKSVHPKVDPEDETELLVLVLSEESDDMMSMLFDTINKVVDEMIIETAESDTYASLLSEGVREGIARTRKRLLKPPADGV